jgi:hypothetical protein
VPAVIAKLRNLAPYAALELVMPGGSVMAILLWLYRRRKQQGHGPSNQAFNMDGPVPYLQSAPITTDAMRVQSEIEAAGSTQCGAGAASAIRSVRTGKAACRQDLRSTRCGLADLRGSAR